MELIIDEKGRKVIDVPFLMLERNQEWNAPKAMPYLEPEEKFILPKDQIPEPIEEKVDGPEADHEMYLCTEKPDEIEEDECPDSKKRKLHFGGLNLKRKEEKNKPEVVQNLASAPDEFDEW